MIALRPFRFGVIAYDARSKEAWVAKARRIEQLGYSILLVPDHLGKQLAPVPAILAAVEATHSLRVGSYVFANDFRHPVMLPRKRLLSTYFRMVGSSWVSARDICARSTNKLVSPMTQQTFV